MRLLRAIFIAVLAISIPLPATAAAFGASHCPSMSAGAETGAMAMTMQHTPHATDHGDKTDCTCAGDAQCAMLCAAGASALPGIDLRASGLSPGGDRLLPSTVPGPRPPHPQAPFRPPSRA